mmetsp:Transcript_21225/g.47637  ORF Transcript_21225/g.47637 Transcript_21225/m.47637 type:complete len:223 (-) Transcript_21225:1584-2252(-)
MNIHLPPLGSDRQCVECVHRIAYCTRAPELERINLVRNVVHAQLEHVDLVARRLHRHLPVPSAHLPLLPRALHSLPRLAHLCCHLPPRLLHALFLHCLRLCAHRRQVGVRQQVPSLTLTRQLLHHHPQRSLLHGHLLLDCSALLRAPLDQLRLAHAARLQRLVELRHMHPPPVLLGLSTPAHATAPAPSLSHAAIPIHLVVIDRVGVDGGSTQLAIVAGSAR